MKNPITINDLKALLTNEQTQAEALEFYFEFVPTGPLTGEYRLCSHIQVVESYDVNKNGLREGAPLFNIAEQLIKSANNIARRGRDKLFDQRKADPSRTVIVTEGDSWFQYPKYKRLGITLSKEVKDVIDYLIEHPKLAVKSVGAAADVIRNMFHTSEYLEAIDELNPKIFILSGGGNDFFSVFPHMVTKGDLADIQTFLKQSWKVELDVIRAYYQGIIDLLAAAHPDLHIIVHGYDYVMPRLDGKWIGRPMIESGGIGQDADRKQLIRFIMDEFNQMIEALAASSEKVHYVDVRGVVPQDPQFWHDEIHPNDYGFRLVADRFIAEIERVLEA